MQIPDCKGMIIRILTVVLAGLLVPLILGVLRCLLRRQKNGRSRAAAAATAAICDQLDASRIAPGDFIFASQFEGKKPGFMFSSGRNGVGYYRDKHQRKRPTNQETKEPGAVLGPQKKSFVITAAPPMPASTTVQQAIQHKIMI